MLRLEDVRRSFQLGPVTTEVLHGVNLNVVRGDLMSIMGPSGSGKTTLMNIIGLLDRPSSGTCWIEERDIANLRDDELSALRNRKIGFVFQSFHLLSQLSAIENVCLPLVYRGTTRGAARKRAGTLLEQVGMGQRKNHRPSQLSGGQKQRVAIARALVGNPALLLADEPTGALDPETTADVMDLLLKLNTEQGVTILIITHDSLVAAQCIRQMQIHQGRLIEQTASGEDV
ncbi:MAG: ABC transporter ATP-binding protein [Rhodobacteraceae bacterium]|nr:ABC transporter ATP-binding protein [Paracoccaceae bacterium]